MIIHRENDKWFERGGIFAEHIDGLVQEKRNFSALAVELRLSCINPSIWYRPAIKPPGACV